MNTKNSFPSNIFITNDIGLWEWHPQSNVLHINPKWAQMLGYSIEELEPLTLSTWEKLVHPLDYNNATQLLKEHLEGKTPIYECEVRLKHKEGHWVYVIDRGQIISYSDEGKPLLFSGYHLDITHRKEVEEKLLANQRLLHGIINEMPDVFVLKDEKGDFLLCNQTVAKLYNTTPDAMVGKHDDDFGVPQAIAHSMKQNVLEIMEKGKTCVVYEDSHDSKTGEIRHFRSIKKPLKDAQGKNQILVIAQDITDIIEANKKIADNEKRLNNVFEATQEGIWDWHIPTGHVEHNSHWYSIFGYENNELTNTVDAFSKLIHPDDKTLVWERLSAVLNSTAELYQSEHRMIHKNGDILWVQDRGKITERDALNAPVRMVGSFSNITQRKLDEERLKLLANVFSYAKEGILITNKEGVILEVNDAYTLITGYEKQESIGATPRILRSDRHSEVFYNRMWDTLLKEDFWSGELWNRKKSGTPYLQFMTVSAIKNDQGHIQFYVAIFSDITAQRKHEEELEFVAHYDSLTNLPNRLLLSDRLLQALSKSKRSSKKLAIAYIDLDGFKEINDTYGHTMGDTLLKVVAKRMQQTLREEDTLARLGGDEFVAVLATDESLDIKDGILHRLLSSISKPIIIDEFTLHVSASIGVTFYPQMEEIDADQLLRQADYAMYQAKLLGKNCCYLFDVHNDQSIRNHHQWLYDIKRGMEQSEFELYYQPKVVLKTQKTFGVEALIRWNHPEKGLLSPIIFLPEIETHALGITIGEWVIDTALSTLETLHAKGYKLTMSVNISAFHFQQINFVERLKYLLSTHPTLNPRYLELEILETSAMKDVHHASMIMKECINLGVSFSLDDFGTGYSSLTYLKLLPAKTIKIDQSFIRDILKDPEDAKIVQGIMGLAKAFERDVIAEGIEDKEHIDALLKLKCPYGQGYAFARPMPLEATLNWLKKNPKLLSKIAL